ncbi:MAG: isoprenoid biosynthesis glyoxalase ElbB [Bdellovibrionales bacterium]|nr:isoprenoid biosynthesis glyoxalase ElbB [Bdellovibrionales bacterium]
MSKKIAVVLSGCGYLDGAEINETVFSLLALDQQNLKYDAFAPNIDTYHVINHQSGESTEESRNVLTEAARIVRGKIQDLENLNIDNYGALILPGGYGVAKNLSDFAFKGSAAKVLPALETVIRAFHQAKKPIGAICISPAIVARVLGEHSVKLTIGSDAETASEIEKCGAEHIQCSVQDVVVDSHHKIASTPAFMYDNARLTDIYKGISSCIEQVRIML